MLTVSFCTIVSVIFCVVEARPVGNANPKLIRFFDRFNGLGNYSYMYQASDGLYREESGTVVNSSNVIKGAYLYSDGDIKYEVRYIADEEGFRPSVIQYSIRPGSSREGRTKDVADSPIVRIAVAPDVQSNAVELPGPLAGVPDEVTLLSKIEDETNEIPDGSKNAQPPHEKGTTSKGESTTELEEAESTTSTEDHSTTSGDDAAIHSKTTTDTETLTTVATTVTKSEEDLHTSTNVPTSAPPVCTHKDEQGNLDTASTCLEITGTTASNPGTLDNSASTHATSNEAEDATTLHENLEAQTINPQLLETSIDTTALRSLVGGGFGK